MGEKVPEGIESKEARKAFMKANMDAGFASELAPDYAKAQYRYMQIQVVCTQV